MTSDNRIISNHIASESNHPVRTFHLRARALGVQILRKAIEIVLPSRCIDCDVIVADHQALCASCWSKLPWITSPFDEASGLPLAFANALVSEGKGPDLDPVIRRVRYAAQYDATARNLVISFKFADRPELAEPMALWLKSNASELVQEADVIVPVPLHKRRLLARKYNQAAELARYLSEGCGLDYEPTALKRLRNTAQQVGTDRAARLKNVSGAFSVPAESRHLIAGRKILLVDDVVTTGATTNACARALIRAGAVQVDVTAFAVVTTT